MATVYLATDVKHDRKVAIKVLHEDLSATIGAERFEREIKLAAKLQHPNILGLYDSGQTDGLLYYVMPFVEGEALRDRLDREGQLPIEDAIQLILEVADALGYAHKQGIVHRDIKPENILISNGHALVADFGIARAVEEGGAAKLTQTGMAVGTPVYMSPEQGAGEKVGPASDIYSLGCMLYEMLAGEPPFTGKNAVQIMARHAMEQVPSIRIIRQSVPDEVEEAIFAALEKAPVDRPATCGDFAEILGMPLGATATRRVMGRTSTRRLPTGMTRSQPMLEARAPAWRRPWVLAVLALVLAGGGFGAWRITGAGGAGDPATAGLNPRRVAVLYFDNASGDPGLDYLADGLTEGLIQTLMQVQGLSVISRTGVEPFRTGSISNDSIGRALDAGTLVRGSMTTNGDRLRVSVSLIDGTSGADLGERASFEQASTDLVAVRDSLAQRVAGLIRTRIGQEVLLRDQRSSTRSTEAWSLLQRAELAMKRGETAVAANDTAARRVAFGEADSLLALAEAADARWVDPKVFRARIAYRWTRVLPRSDVQAIMDWHRIGMAHVDRALAVDPGHADALEVRGNLQYWQYLLRLEPDPAKAEALLASAQSDLEAATRSNPNQAGAWSSLSHLYNYSKTAVDVKLAATRALEADAFLADAGTIMTRLVLASYDLGQFADADRWCQETRRRFPEQFTAPRCELFLLTTSSRSPAPERAWALADSVIAMADANRRQYYTYHSHMLVAAVLGRAGLADSARAVIRRSLSDGDFNPTRDLALFGAFAATRFEDTTLAVDLLKLYITANPQAGTGLADDPGWWFGGISQDPGFRQLVGSR